MPREWALGACCALTSTSLSAAGQTLQRLSHVRAKHSGDLRGPWYRPLWFLGVIIYLLASPLDLAAFYYAPFGLVVGVYGVKLPLVAVLARVFLEVRISTRCAAGIGFCVAGSLLSLACAPRVSSGVIQVAGDFYTPVLCGYLVFTGCAWVLLVLLAISTRRTTFLGMDVFGSSSFGLPLLTAWIFQVEKLFNSGMGLLGPTHSFASARWAWMPASVAIFGLVELYLNLTGLVHQSTHTFVPMVAAFGSLITGFQSFVVLGEFAGSGITDFTLWATGLAVSLMGAALVGSSGQLEPSDHIEYTKMSSCKV